MSPLAENLMDQLYEAPNFRLTAIVEMARVPPPVRQALMERFAQTAYPILHQKCFANIRDIGPWLFSSGERLSLDGQYDFHCTVLEMAPDAPCAWLVSGMEPSKLAHHLGQAAIVRAPDGSPHLLRFYSEHAFPVLFERHDLPGVAEMLAPIRSWWALEPDPKARAWRHYRCHHTPERCAAPRIQLDPACWDALINDPLTYRLAGLLKPGLSAGRPETCPGTRLEHVRTLLAEARKKGLSRPEDLSDYVILLSHHGQGLQEHPAWLAVMAEVRDDGHPFAQALHKRLAQHFK